MRTAGSQQSNLQCDVSSTEAFFSLSNLSRAPSNNSKRPLETLLCHLRASARLKLRSPAFADMDGDLPSRPSIPMFDLLVYMEDMVCCGVVGLDYLKLERTRITTIESNLACRATKGVKRYLKIWEVP